MHAERGREAFERASSAPNDRYEVERGDALRELTRAVVLEPTDRGYHAALASALAQPPREIPEEITQELRADSQRVIPSGAKQSVVGMASWIVVPQVIMLSGGGTLAFLAIANVTILLVPSLFIAKLRSDLTDVQARQLVQKWQFRRLGDELTR
ncbi:hypothetical protein BH11MYX2_BH11MYX2_38140 [soil metagenome]